MDQLVKLFKALGDKNRIRIVKMLQQKDLCVCEITAILELATSTVSKHLSILKDANLIGDHKKGKWVEYYLKTAGNNLFINGLLPLIAFWLNDDEQVKSDSVRLKTTDRSQLCNL
ncbi:winged helix-turn-helix transcriptional regulator [candidate division KSB1 bacterium]|nr:winged helix-turn-helix transcriptional regulator [candidate division KSB1 bacterium]